MPALDHFSAPTRAWFEAAFAAAHRRAGGGVGRDRRAASTRWWSRRPARQDAQRLPARHRHAARPAERPEDKSRRSRVLYISPLKALAVDVERNLRAPLTGIRHTAERLGTGLPDLAVGLRSGDTSARRPAQADEQPARHPDHHARVALPDAHQPGPRVAARRRDGDPRRGARRRRRQARRPPRRLPRAARRPPRPARPAHRAVARPCVRWRRWRASSAAARRSRSWRPRARRSGTCGWSSRSRT